MSAFAEKSFLVFSLYIELKSSSINFSQFCSYGNLSADLACPQMADVYFCTYSCMTVLSCKAVC